MTAEPRTDSDGTSRRGRLVLVVALALVAVVVLAAVIVVRGRQPAPVAATAADCEKAPPKVEFAVAECDGGEAPGEDAVPAAGAPGSEGASGQPEKRAP